MIPGIVAGGMSGKAGYYGVIASTSLDSKP